MAACHPEIVGGLHAEPQLGAGPNELAQADVAKVLVEHSARVGRSNIAAEFALTPAVLAGQADPAARRQLTGSTGALAHW